jgi:hypothetical protein
VWSNWDVEELLARKAEIVENQELLTIGIMGLSFRHWGMQQVQEYVSGVRSA